MVSNQPIKYPSIEECFQYFDQFEMLDNIREHSMQVARVALVVQEGLAKKSKKIPLRGVVAAGALLHDIAKTLCLREKCRHAIIGKEMCEDLGYPEIGEIVQQHVILKFFDEESYLQGKFTAGELVYYSDKRVRHNQVVSLQERFDYIMDVYGNRSPESAQIIQRSCRECIQLEKYLFSFTDFSPEDLSELVETITF